MDILLSIIKVCNDNNGFIMALLTLVYVIATIFICVFNYKSAKEAKNQIEAGNAMQKQNIDMQLFEMRKNLIRDLEEALDIKVQYFTKVLFGSGIEEKYEEKVVVLLNEIPYLFQRDDFEFVYQANDCLKDVQKYLKEYNEQYVELTHPLYKGDFKEKLERFSEMTKNFLDNVIDENSYKNLSKTVNAQEMCRCMIGAKQKYFEASELLDKNDLQDVFKTKYLSFK